MLARRGSVIGVLALLLLGLGALTLHRTHQRKEKIKVQDDPEGEHTIPPRATPLSTGELLTRMFAAARAHDAAELAALQSEVAAGGRILKVCYSVALFIENPSKNRGLFIDAFPTDEDGQADLLYWLSPGKDVDPYFPFEAIGKLAQEGNPEAARKLLEAYTQSNGFSSEQLCTDIFTFFVRQPALAEKLTSRLDGADKIQILYCTPTPPGPRFFEATVAGVRFEHGPRFIEKHGGGLKRDDGLVHRFYLNADKTELLDLIFHPGGGRDCVSEATAQTSTRAAKLLRDHEFDEGPVRLEAVPALEMTSFATGKGIRLGATSEEVKRILGQPHKREIKDGVASFIYRCDDSKQCPMLDLVNLPDWQATYRFEKDRLVELSVGFPYP